MADIEVTFIHPTTNEPLEATIDDGMTPSQIVVDLINEKFIPADPQGYAIGVKGGQDRLPNDRPVAQAGITTGSKLLVIPQTDAGSVTIALPQ
jgi:hypothetical protein